MKYILILFLVGCVSQGNIVDQADIVNNHMSSGEVHSAIKRAKLSSTDETIINHAASAYIRFYDQFEQYIRDPLSASDTNYKRLEDEYKNLRRRYAEVEKVVVSHFNDYSEEDQLMILYYQNLAYELDREAVNFNDDKHRYENIINTLRAGGAIMELAIMAGI